MRKRPSSNQVDLVFGALDVLILRTLLRGPTHGHGIAKSIERLSEDTLKVEHGSLYPALHRLELEGLIDSEWGQSSNNRRAKYYRLTTSGRKQLTQESARWKQIAGAIARVMEMA